MELYVIILSHNPKNCYTKIKTKRKKTKFAMWLQYVNPKLRKIDNFDLFFSPLIDTVISKV